MYTFKEPLLIVKPPREYNELEQNALIRLQDDLHRYFYKKADFDFYDGNTIVTSSFQNITRKDNGQLYNDIKMHDDIFQKVLKQACLSNIEDHIFQFFSLETASELNGKAAFSLFFVQTMFNQKYETVSEDPQLTFSVGCYPVLIKDCAIYCQSSEKLLESHIAFYYAHELAHIEHLLTLDKASYLARQNDEKTQHQEEKGADNRGLEIALKAGYSAADCIIACSICDSLDDGIHEPTSERQRYMLNHYLDLCDKKEADVPLPEDAKRLLEQDFATPTQKDKLKSFIPEEKKIVAEQPARPTYSWVVQKPAPYSLIDKGPLRF